MVIGLQGAGVAGDDRHVVFGVVRVRVLAATPLVEANGPDTSHDWCPTVPPVVVLEELGATVVTVMKQADVVANFMRGDTADPSAGVDESVDARESACEDVRGLEVVVHRRFVEGEEVCNPAERARVADRGRSVRSDDRSRAELKVRRRRASDPVLRRLFGRYVDHEWCEVLADVEPDPLNELALGRVEGCWIAVNIICARSN